MFKQTTIIGFGLIGSSIARAMKLHGITETLVAADQSEEACKTIEELKLADHVTTNIASSVKGSDLVIICTPVGAFRSVIQTIAPLLEKDAIITDVASVKQRVIEDVMANLPERVTYIPGHPIAGAEHTGPESGFPELFQNRWCILTPIPETPLRPIEKVTYLWETMGSMIEIMDPEHHDMVLGITSHLPHLIAYAIVGTASQLEDDLKSEVIKFSASGFRDFTRIAASSPVMWRDIFLNNRKAVLEIIQRFSEDLTALQKSIRRGDGQFLFDFFTKTRGIRREIIDQGQANYTAPGGVNQPGTPVPYTPEKHQK